MEVVLDTNVWLSGIFWKGEAYNLISYCINKKIEIIVSKEILEEIIEVVSREEKFSKYLSNMKDSFEELIRTILLVSKFVETKTKLDIVKADPKDNIILEVALDVKAEYIITYDNHLLNMIEFRKIKIVNPKEFLKEIMKR